MQAILFVTAFCVILFCSWGFFLALGNRTGGFLATKAARDAWLVSQNPNLIRLQNICAIMGTLTSFATVFIFYLVNAKDYGIFILATLPPLYFSYQITNWATGKMLQQPSLKERSIDADQAGAALAKIFWSADPYDKRVSAIVQLISLLSVMGILWLEFSVLAILFQEVSGGSLLWGTSFIFVLSFFVFLFTTTYGLRGFIFADLFQVPIMILCFVLLFGAALAVWFHPPTDARDMPTSVWEFLAPTKPWLVCALFVLHVVALNLFFPLATESHWLRLWAFRETEIAVQRPAMAATALLPAPLVFMGIVAFYISSGSSPDVPAFVREIVPFVNAISEVSPVLSFMFWIGAVAALFSTADTQIYSALVLARFDSRTGDVRIGLNSPWLFAFFSSLLFAAVYAVVRAREIEFDRIIFAVIPCALILLPAIIDAARGSKPSLAKLGTAGFGYGVFSIYGLLVQDKEALQANLAAVLFPVILACFPARKENSNAAIKGPS